MTYKLSLERCLNTIGFIDKLLEGFAEFLRVCPTCHRSYRKTKWLCKPCYQKLCKQSAEEITEYNFKTLSLWRWTANNNHFMRPAVYSLKGGDHPFAFNFLAKELIYNGLIQKNINKFQLQNTLIIPAPPKAEFDHATCLAKSVAAQLGANYRNILQRPTEQLSQKQSSLILRKNKQLVATQLINRNHPVIFIDDVITSGSTAKAAYKALGQPKYYRVWTLFHKQKEA